MNKFLNSLGSLVGAIMACILLFCAYALIFGHEMIELPLNQDVLMSDVGRYKNSVVQYCHIRLREGWQCQGAVHFF